VLRPEVQNDNPPSIQNDGPPSIESTRPHAQMAHAPRPVRRKPAARRSGAPPPLLPGLEARLATAAAPGKADDAPVY
jgi:hypothetical protein